MKFKKNLKRFMTLDRHHAEGFTLVELIVVIAILAILGGVAVPAYGGYVKKANKQADISLISEVKQALELYYYSNGGNTASFAIILDQEGNVVAIKGDEEQAEVAMQAAFGEGWRSLGLKYADWKGESSALSYADSSYKGNESSLIGKVDSLTTALGEVVSNDESMSALVIGTNFEQFLKDNNVATEGNGKGVGNAAVLYVAQNTAGQEELIQKAFADSISGGFTSPSDLAGKVYNKLDNEIGSAAALAAVYAYAEGYAQATGQASTFTTDFTGVKNANDALTVLCDSFNNLAKDRPANEFEDFISVGADGKSQSDKNIQAYVDMMGTVNDNKDIVSDNLNDPNCFTDGTVEDMLKGHAAMSDLQVQTADGQVAIILYNDGYAWKTAVTPKNWYK